MLATHSSTACTRSAVPVSDKNIRLIELEEVGNREQIMAVDEAVGKLIREMAGIADEPSKELSLVQELTYWRVLLDVAAMRVAKLGGNNEVELLGLLLDINAAIIKQHDVAVKRLGLR